MKSSTLMNLAAVVATGAIVAIAAVLVPERLSGLAALLSLAVFAGAVGMMFYVPAILARRNPNSDAVQMASIGPSGVLSVIVLVVAAVAFVLALVGFDRLAIAMDILAIAALLVGGLSLAAALRVVADVAAKYSVPSRHAAWQSQLVALCSVAKDPALRRELERLAEKLRYSASDVPGGSPQDADIDSTIAALSPQVATEGPAALKEPLSRLELLIAQREVHLRSARSKV